MRTVRNVARDTALDAGPDLTDEQRAILVVHRWEKRFHVG